MAHNCLMEEARESIFTGLEGVADAKRSAGAFGFDLRWPKGGI